MSFGVVRQSFRASLLHSSMHVCARPGTAPSWCSSPCIPPHPAGDGGIAWPHAVQNRPPPSSREPQPVQNIPGRVGILT